MDTKHTFIKRFRAFVSAHGEGEHNHSEAASPPDIRVPKDERDADKRRHVGVFVGSMRLPNHAGTIFGTRESNQAWSKNRDSSEDGMHTPSNLR